MCLNNFDRFVSYVLKYSCIFIKSLNFISTCLWFRQKKIVSSLIALRLIGLKMQTRCDKACIIYTMELLLQVLCHKRIPWKCRMGSHIFHQLKNQQIFCNPDQNNSSMGFNGTVFGRILGLGNMTLSSLILTLTWANCKS